MATMIVHRFTLYNAMEDTEVLAKGWGTADTIEKLGGTIVPNSQREVDASTLTHTGRFHPPEPKG